MARIDEFMAVYKPALIAALEAHPDEYAYPVAHADAVCARMREAFVRGSFNKDSHAIKATCKTLGIKHTYTAIREYLAFEGGN